MELEMSEMELEMSEMIAAKRKARMELAIMEAAKKKAMARSRSADDLKKSGHSTAKAKDKAEAADAVARFRFRAVHDEKFVLWANIDLSTIDFRVDGDYSKEKGWPRSRLITDIWDVGRGYSECDSYKRELVYDRTNPKPANPPEVADCTELAKLAIDFFNKDNDPYMRYTLAVTPLVKVTRDAAGILDRYYLTFLAKPDDNFQPRSRKPGFQFFEARILCKYVKLEDPLVETVCIVDYWNMNVIAKKLAIKKKLHQLKAAMGYSYGQRN